MGSQKSGTTNQTTTSKPWAPTVPHKQTQLGAAENLYQQGGPEFYPNQLTVPRNQLELQTDQNLVNYATGGQFGQMNQAAHQGTTDLMMNPYTDTSNIGRNMAYFAPPTFDRAQQFTNQGVDPSGMGFSYSNPKKGLDRMLSGNPLTNPYLSDTIQANAGEIVENYQDQVLPSIRHSQNLYQPGGSSRGDLLNRQAMEDMNEDIGRMSTRFHSDAYNRALNDQNQAVGMMMGQEGQAEMARRARAGESLSQYGAALDPAFAGEQLGLQRFGTGMSSYPTVTNQALSMTRVPGQVGGIQRGFQQQLTNDDIQRWNYEQNLPYNTLQNYINQVNAVGGGYGTNRATGFETYPGGGMQGLIGGGLGGALSGAALGSMLGPPGTAAGAMYGAMGGGGLGLLGGGLNY